MMFCVASNGCLRNKVNYFVFHFLKVLIINDLGIFEGALLESLSTTIKYQKCKENGTENVNNP